MNSLYKSWTELKALATTKDCSFEYHEHDYYYAIFFEENSVGYFTEIWKDTSKVKGINVSQNNTDKTDFETNHKSSANALVILKSADGKVIVRTESRPINCTTCFCAQADSGIDIGDGKILGWDFSNDDDDITPSGVNYKRKRIEFTFLDPIWIKEGALYYHNVSKGSYIDLYVVCPSGQYYYDNEGTPTLATSDTIIAHYMIRHPIQGTVAMGDELNTESCSSEIPSAYKFWLDVTVPNSDATSNGHLEIELYRTRTVIL